MFTPNNYIRLRDENSVVEFYTANEPANYLKDIKDLNIIVGANNSRKSRFIRRLINLEHRVIVNSIHDINKSEKLIESVFENLTDEKLSTKLLGFIFNDYNDNPDIYKKIREFFDRKVGIDTGVNLDEIKTMLLNVVNTLNKVAVPDDVKNLHLQTDTHLQIVKLITQIYQKLKINFNNFKANEPNDSGIKGITYKISDLDSGVGIPDFEERLLVLEQSTKILKNLLEINIECYYDVDLIYLPVLRASRRLEGVGTDVFRKTLQSQHKIKENSKLTIETGLDLYEKIEMARNGHRKDRENFAAFEDFISKVFFQGKTFDIIAVKSSNSVDKNVKVSIEGEIDDVPIHELGDGIQNIITLLLPVFTAKQKSWVFIDEPENHLHPGFQNIFLRTISENETIKAKALKFFINTHSNHILSESFMGTAETEILVFSRRDKDSSNIQAFSGIEYNTLAMLGAFNTSVLITNCSIWVEGITDRLYLRAFLNAYTNADPSKTLPLEGFHYSYLEYAGNNIVHYDFNHELAVAEDNAATQIKAFFLNSNVFLLADSDFSKDEKHNFYDKISDARGNFEYFKTDLPEIENLIPDNLLKKWLIEGIKCKSVEVENCFKTPNNGVKLGKYFDGKFTRGQNSRKFSDKGHGGTLRPDYKMKLADYIHNGIMKGTISWDELKESEILGKLVSKLYDFIMVKNGDRIGAA